MKTLFVSAVALALAGIGMVQAEDGEAESALSAPEVKGAEFRWREFDSGESTLLRQLNAVYRMLRAEIRQNSDEESVSTVQVEGIDDAEIPAGDCRLMPVPGSRIRAIRCYYPSEGELALNEYQFREELRFIRQQQEIQALEQARELDLARQAVTIQNALSGPR